MVIWRRLGIVLAAIAVLILALWMARARFVAEAARAYFHSHGIDLSIDVDTFGLWNISGRFALGPADAPTLSADRIELHFDPLSWMPRLTDVQLVNPVVRARINDQGQVILPSLQAWIELLQNQPAEQSRFVADNLAVSLRNLRAYLATPGGALEVDGDIRLVDSLPVSATLSARPTHITYQGTTITVQEAGLDFEKDGGRLIARYAGSMQSANAKAENVIVAFDASGLLWRSEKGSLVVTAPLAHLAISAAALTADYSVSTPKLEITAQAFSASLADGKLDGQADLSLAAGAGFDPGALTALRAQDPGLANAVTRNLAHLDLTLAAHVERHGQTNTLALTAPLVAKGATGGTLQVSKLTLKGGGSDLNGEMEASLNGGGLPKLELQSHGFAIAKGALTAQASLKGQFNFAMLRGAALAASGTLSWRDNRFAFSSGACAHATLAAFRPGPSELAKDISGDICAVPDTPLIAGDTAHWTFSGAARGVSAVLPLADARLDNGAGRLRFAAADGALSGNIAVTAARMSDRQSAKRFNPVLGSGTITLAGGVWRGRFKTTDNEKFPLGDVTFTHFQARGSGNASIAAPNLVFSPDKLQPESISPLLAKFRRAEGSASFQGTIDWTSEGLNSRGKLVVGSMNFLTPMGEAHSTKTEIDFTSLLPPVSADNQGVTISRVDWTLPLSTVGLKFSFSPTAIHVGGVDSDIAGGHVSMDPFTIDLANPGRVEGKAQLTSISLAALVAASNLGSKLKLDSMVSGEIPFVSGPEGFRISGGHIAADAPGHLSIDPSLWAESGSASTNAVQDFAYQALQNLAFDNLTAELNSVDNGRLRVVFHIRGWNDPPTPQTANIPVTDLLNGSAFQKKIPLPSKTPIDLTLDVSLNFDELLKSYTDAWTSSISSADATPRAKQ